PPRAARPQDLSRNPWSQLYVKPMTERIRAWGRILVSNAPSGQEVSDASILTVCALGSFFAGPAGSADRLDVGHRERPRSNRQSRCRQGPEHVLHRERDRSRETTGAGGGALGQDRGRSGNRGVRQPRGAEPGAELRRQGP